MRGRHRLQHVDSRRLVFDPLGIFAAALCQRLVAFAPQFDDLVRDHVVLRCGHILPRLDMAIAHWLPAISEGTRRSLLFQIVSDG